MHGEESGLEYDHAHAPILRTIKVSLQKETLHYPDQSSQCHRIAWFPFLQIQDRQNRRKSGSSFGNFHVCKTGQKGMFSTKLALSCQTRHPKFWGGGCGSLALLARLGSHCEELESSLLEVCPKCEIQKVPHVQQFHCDS